MVEWGRLEICCTFRRTVGSNPTLSVIFKYKSLIIMTNFEICDIACHFTYHFMWLMEISKRQVEQVTGRGSM